VKKSDYFLFAAIAAFVLLSPVLFAVVLYAAAS
jgi:hypothetical protein